MLRIAVIDDEINDLLAVIEHLVSLDMDGSRINIVPVLLSTDTQSSVTKQSAWRQKSFLENLDPLVDQAGVADFEFPAVKLLGPLNATNLEECARILEYLAHQEVDLIISDSSMGEETAGIVLLETAVSDARWVDKKWQCWLMTKWERVAKTIRDFRWRGKFDPYARYLDKEAIIKTAGSGEVHPDLLRVVEAALKEKAVSLEGGGRRSFGALVGQSPPMNGKRGVYQLIEAYARMPTSEAVLIMGDTGTGKELVACELHNCSGVSGPFVTINSAAIPKELVESELFGHEKDAFTGARTRRVGKFELAKRGTLFLDEIGELPSDTQAKLLRAIEERKFHRLGGHTEVNVDDVRLIAATNRNLPGLIEGNLFRQDLYYRLANLIIETPTLSERREDIPLLVEHFIQQFNQRLGRNLRITESALNILVSHSWPGNVRELRTSISRAFGLAEGDEITEQDIQLDRNSGQLSSRNSALHGSGRETLEVTASSSSGLLSRDDCANKSASEILSLITSGRLVVELAKLKNNLGEGNFIQLLKLIQAWTHERYNREYLPDAVARAMFGMDGESYRQRMYQYKQKYGI